MLKININDKENIFHQKKKKKWLEKIVENNVTIALNILYVKKNIYIYPAYVSKNNSNREKQVILLMN